ncbi:MAG: acetyl/propionyl/methylcrotonyl-CoA carboxylase subunit alpha [Magnetococcales bacterium]|nr:acetyl/propionyl/methylcrotonyl-CoA carboxylase subunit alpha [Magnetococcales bacterium]
MKKILIANRGEIACRVMRAAKKMGIATVAVYSDADRHSLHTRTADEAVHIGPPPSAESYLVMEKIIDACKKTGADAIHPGYGFLSENPAFRRLLETKGITFIGPSAEAIEAMGDKISSKKLAIKAGVRTIPGHMGVIQDPDEAVKISREIGYPVMIKASAGGGGKGMRIAHNDEEAATGWKSASSEGKSFFGDDRVFIEKFIEQPRHIEIQVLADTHGNAFWLNERECSIQRRNQKVVEEAPSPFLDPETRKAMGEQAVALAKAVGYASAGTVEFVVGKDRDFYFLEMNTRLQVEHPITEMITGVDLAEWMIRVARGEKIPWKQEDVALNGWAVESRVYAENPYRNFLPSIGRLVRFQPPKEGKSVRVDTGVFEGGEVSMFYDPMIAKLVTWGRDREEAMERMGEALDSFLISGCGHNIDFLNAVVRHPRFRSGNITTNFIAEEFPDGFSGAPLTEEDRHLFAAAAVCIERAELSLFQEQPDIQNLVATVAGTVPIVMRVSRQPGILLLEAEDGVSLEIAETYHPGEQLATFNIAGKDHHFQINRLDEGYELAKGGVRRRVLVRSPRVHALGELLPEKEPPDLSKFLISQMPGLVLSVDVKPGDAVVAGDALLVLEAMKMENIMQAEQDGVVKSVSIAKGDTVEANAVLMEFE